jgi:hypothetical protein
MFPVRFNPHVHRIHDVPFTRFIRGHLKDPDLFTYRHEVTGNWLVAFWLKPRELMQELVCAGPEPVFTREHTRDIELMVADRPGAAEARKRALRHMCNQDQIWGRHQVEDWAEEQDAWRFLLGRLNSHKREHPLLRTLAGLS